MIGYHGLESRRLRLGDLLYGGDPAVDGHQQPCPSRRQALDRGRGKAVPVLEAAGKEPADVGFKRLQRAYQYGRRAYAVHVVVAVDRDPRSGVDMPADQRHGPLDPFEGGRIVALLRFQERECRPRIWLAPPYEYLRQDVADTQLSLDPVCHGEVVSGDLQARRRPPRPRRRFRDDAERGPGGRRFGDPEGSGFGHPRGSLGATPDGSTVRSASRDGVGTSRDEVVTMFPRKRPRMVIGTGT